MEKLCIWDLSYKNSSLQEFFSPKIFNNHMLHLLIAFSICYTKWTIISLWYVLKLKRIHIFFSIQIHKTNWYICKSSRIIPEVFPLVRPWYVNSLGGLQRIKRLFQIWLAGSKVAKCLKKWVSILHQLHKIRPGYCLAEFKFSQPSCSSRSQQHWDRWY